MGTSNDRDANTSNRDVPKALREERHNRLRSTRRREKDRLVISIESKRRSLPYRRRASLASVLTIWCCLAAQFTPVLAQTPELVLDITGDSLGSLHWAVKSASQDGALFFAAAANPATPSKLWTSRGSEVTTKPVLDSSNEHRYPSLLTAIGSSLVLMSAEDSSGDEELWASDGNSVWRVADINPTGSSDPHALVHLDGLGVFVADDGEHGAEVWRSDGTEAGTFMVRDVYEGAEGSDPASLSVLGNAVIFTATTASSQLELWRTDGSAGGTYRFSTGTGLVSVTGAMSALPGSDPPLAFFTGGSPSVGLAPWRTNGADGGTSVIADICDEIYSCIQGQVTAFRTRNASGALFRGHSDNGFEPWITDGTALGTEELVDIDFGSTSSWPRDFSPAATQVFFTAEHQNTGRELWRTNGTPQGTFLIKDILPGSDGSEPQDFVVWRQNAFFVAKDDVHGWELWYSDGTSDGTAMVADLLPGPGPTGALKVQLLEIVDNTLYFAADDGATGFELWRLKLPEIFNDDFESGTVSAWDAP